MMPPGKVKMLKQLTTTVRNNRVLGTRHQEQSPVEQSQKVTGLEKRSHQCAMIASFTFFAVATVL